MQSTYYYMFLKEESYNAYNNGIPELDSVWHSPFHVKRLAETKQGQPSLLRPKDFRFQIFPHFKVPKVCILQSLPKSIS